MECNECCPKEYRCFHLWCSVIFIILFCGGLALIIEGVVINIDFKQDNILTNCTVEKIFAKKDVCYSCLPRLGCRPFSYTGCVTFKYHSGNNKQTSTLCPYCGATAKIAIEYLWLDYNINSKIKCWYEKKDPNQLMIVNITGNLYVLFGLGSLLTIGGLLFIFVWVSCYRSNKRKYVQLQNKTESNKILNEMDID